jgi:hypothetical protein
MMNKKEMEMANQHFTREKIEQAYQDRDTEKLYRAAVYFPIAIKEHEKSVERVLRLIKENPSKIDEALRTEIFAILEGADATEQAPVTKVTRIAE